MDRRHRRHCPRDPAPASGASTRRTGSRRPRSPSFSRTRRAASGSPPTAAASAASSATASKLCRPPTACPRIACGRCSRTAKAVSGSEPSRAARSGSATAPPRRLASIRVCSTEVVAGAAPGSLRPVFRRTRRRRPRRPRGGRDVRGRSGARPPERGRHPGAVRRWRGGHADRIERGTLSLARRRADAPCPISPVSPRRIFAACSGIARTASGSGLFAASLASTPRDARSCERRRAIPDGSSPPSIRMHRTRCGSDRSAVGSARSAATRSCRTRGPAWPHRRMTCGSLPPAPAGRSGSAPPPPSGAFAATRRCPSIGPTASRATRRSPFWTTDAARSGSRRTRVCAR